MTVVIGTTTCAVFMDQEDTWKAWLRHADKVRYFAEQAGHAVKYFAALETDARGIEPMRPLVDAVEQLGGDWWQWSLDDGRTELTTGNRLRHITTGQNLVTDYCVADPDVTHLLFMAADCAPPMDVVPRMLEMGHPLVAPFITTYGLRGPRAAGFDFHVEDATASAAAVFIAREVFCKIRWRWDLDTQRSDDFCYHDDALELLGIPTYVRHDVTAKHYPECVPAVEERGHDLAVFR